VSILRDEDNATVTVLYSTVLVEILSTHAPKADPVQVEHWLIRIRDDHHDDEGEEDGNGEGDGFGFVVWDK
jgi:hypothetical protein